MRAIQITEFGGPEVLRLVELPDPEPSGDQVRYDVLAAGVNYADTHQAENSYLAKQTLPLIPGAEFVGVGPDGVRTVGLLFGGGGYAEKVVAPPALTWPVPDGVSDSAALAIVLQGLTAWHLLRTCAHLAPGETVVVLAAAGGVGSIAVQLAKQWGAGRVIGVTSGVSTVDSAVSTMDKQALVRSLGADEVVDAGTDDLTAALIAANGGSRVDIVLEMVGGSVFDASLAALGPFGRLVTYGMAGRTPPEPVQVGALIARSQAVIGFWLAQCGRRPGMLREPVAELLDMVDAGALTTVDGGSYPLADAARAHEDIRSRRTAGKLTLVP